MSHIMLQIILFLDRSHPATYNDMWSEAARRDYTMSSVSIDAEM